jgi:hypothetical protein
MARECGLHILELTGSGNGAARNGKSPAGDDSRRLAGDKNAKANPRGTREGGGRAGSYADTAASPPR